MKMHFGFSSFVAMLSVLAIFACLFAFVSPASAGWSKTGVKEDGVTYYDSNSSGVYLQTAIVGGTYNNVATPSGSVTSGWDSSTVQAGVAYGVSTGNYQIKQSSDGNSWYLLTNILDWF